MRTPLPIVYFSNERERGGVEEHILTLLRGLDRERFEPHLACTPELARALEPDLGRAGAVEITTLTLRRPTDLGAARELARLLRRTRAQVLHSHLFFASLFASPIGRICRVPVIVETPHVREQWRQGWKASYRVDRMAALAVDRFIAVSEANAEYLRRQKGLPAHKVVVIPNGCDLSRFHPEATPSPELRASFGIRPGDPVLVTLARLEPQKGHRYLIEAMPKLCARFPRLRLICVGEGSLREALEAQVAQLGLGEHVHFPGYHSAVGDYLALATATVLPSLYEGLPLAALESLAAGKPVLATAVDGTPEVVRHMRHGLTFAPADAEAIAEAASQALADPVRCRAWGEQGRRWVEERFSDRAQVEQTSRLYESALGGTGRARGAAAGTAWAREAGKP